MSDEEEEVTVYVDFNGMLDEEVLNQPNLKFQILGTNTEHPIIQIGDETYQGDYEDSVGTNVIFVDDKSPVTSDPVFGREVPRRVKYLCKTNKTLKMTRIFLTEKNTPTTSTSNAPELTFSGTYQEALAKLSECCIKRDPKNNDNPK